MSLKNKLLNNPHLEWLEQVNRTTGELSPKIVAKFYNMRFVKQPSSIRLSGSLHILHRLLTQRGYQNYDDFTYQDLTQIIQFLFDFFGINPKLAKIENLEYGVNVSTIYAPKRILQEHVTLWDYAKPNSDLNFDRLGKYKQWSRAQYYVKAYDKGGQHKLRDNIFRFEKGVYKSIELKKFNIRYLSDLLEIEKLSALSRDLLLQYDKLLFLDSTEPSEQFTAKEREIFIRGTNPSTWNNFNNNTAKMRYKRKFAALVGNFELDRIKQGIKKDICKKYKKLLCNNFIYSKDRNKCSITTQLTARKQHNNSEVTVRNDPKSESEGPTPDVTILPVYIGLKHNKPSKQAISDIRQLHPDHPLRKKTRNEKSNPRNNLRRAILKLLPNEGNVQMLLFPVEAVIQLTKCQENILEYWSGTRFDILEQIAKRS